MAKSIKKRERLNEFPDSKENRKGMEPEDVTMDLPVVKDSPGLENNNRIMDEGSNVSKEEAILLERSADSQAGPEDIAWEQATLDNTDEDGEALNEENEYSGKDLDIPGADDDDMNEEIGEEDEENNSYSLGGEKEI